MISAFSSSGLISVSPFVFEWGSYGVVHGNLRPSSIATIVSHVLCAINELLFWEWSNSQSSLSIHAFNSASSWEGPAWTTLSLIFNSSDITPCRPIDVISNWCRRIIQPDVFIAIDVFFDASTFSLVELSGSQVTQMVDSLEIASRCSILTIVLDDVLVSLAEDWKSVVVFFFGSIGSLELWYKVNELSFNISDGSGQKGLVRWCRIWIKQCEGGHSTANSDGG